MILVIDAGNSRLKWGVAPAQADVLTGGWQSTGAVENTKLERLAAHWKGLPAPDYVLCANVAGPDVERTVEAALAGWPIKAIWLRPQKEAAGVRNRYHVPAQLGPDRWASAVAAWHRKQSACIVVNAGTATTIDLISASGDFLGGMILPGMIMMKESLQRGTASLGLERGKVDLQARSTADAIETGAAYAQRGAIELARRDFEPGAALLISGGAGGTLAALLSSPFEVVPLLTLEGLFILARAHGRQA